MVVDTNSKVLVKSTDGPVSKYINRKISTRITRAIIKYNIQLTPNQVSIISFILGVFSGLLFVYNNLILGGIITQISSIIDGVDGELARALGRTSRFGGFFDAVLDRLADISVITGLGLLLLMYNGYWYNVFSYHIVFLIIVLALTGDIMVSYIHARAEASLGTSLHKLCSIPVFASRDVRLFTVFVGGLVQRPLEVLLVISALSYAYVVVRLIEVAILYRKGVLS